MPDAWERCNQLDPTSADADLDKDGDGLTNLEEYENLSWAQLNEGHALVNGQGLNVSISSEFDIEHNVMHYAVSPSLFALNSATIPGQNTYVLTVDTDSSWDLDRLPAECSIDAASAQNVICAIDYGGQIALREFYGTPVYFSRGSVAQGTLSATLISDAMDPRPGEANGQASIEIDIESLLTVNMPALSTEFLSAQVERYFGSEDSEINILASFDVPQGVVIESARIESDLGVGYSEHNTSDCSIGYTVICDLDDADNRFVFDIVVEFYVVSPGSYDVTWNFTTNVSGEQHTLLSRTIRFE